MMSVSQVIELLACFFIGAIPFAQVAMWGTGVDITKVGSKNPGFNNVLRVSTKPRALFALLGDISKGYVALLLFASGQPVSLQWMMGIAAVMGHCWNPFLRWNGGKGAATTAGVMLFLDWRITLVCLPLYPLLRMFGRRMKWKQEGAISTLITMTAISTSVLVLRGTPDGIYAFIILAIVIIRHIPNIREVLRSRHPPSTPPSRNQSRNNRQSTATVLEP
jgi:acyl phosphate:glycerol-3-phosphate acyltransferase